VATILLEIALDIAQKWDITDACCKEQENRTNEYEDREEESDYQARCDNIVGIFC
jgi:hypothetical protein